MIILISAIILLGIVTYYFHRRDLKKQVEKTNKIVQPKFRNLRKNVADDISFANATACSQE